MPDKENKEKLKELILLLLRSQSPYEHAVVPEAEVANADLDAVAAQIADEAFDSIEDEPDLEKAVRAVELHKAIAERADQLG